MFETRIMTSPALVLLSGLAAGALATVLAFSGNEVRPDELSRVVAVGVLAAAGATSMSTWQRWVYQKASQSLDAARHDATHDPLTGLANRSELYRELEQSLAQARADQSVFGVLFLDLDRFKLINDSMGHDAGDELLKAVADRLRASTRSGDVVARLGGDEFVVICRGLLTEESVVTVAQQILRRFAEPVSLKGRDHPVSTSVGVAVADGMEERDPEGLVRDADAAMYVAKRNRSGFAVFDDAHRSYLTNRLDIERDLRRALDEEQLLVYYQPIVDVAADRLYGFEALVRWNHPQRGVLPPGQFLSVAEEARLMPEVGEFVLREACAQAAVWNHLCPEARTIRIGVNVAEQQLVDPELPSLISEILAWSGLHADQLVLEITEDVIVEHLGGLNVLRELHDLGVTLAIDDFGTGQSSLSYVKQFDMVSVLKIDQSFVRDMHIGAADLAIIDAVVAMSSALELRVVAEGVERVDQIGVLADLGIRLMQGFYFNAPLSPDDLLDPHSWFEHDTLSAPDGLRPLAISRRFAGGQLPTPSSRPC
jgi:diguanylate cyclase (GGDEF)-like protein